MYTAERCWHSLSEAPRLLLIMLKLYARVEWYEWRGPAACQHRQQPRLIQASI
jgi:hypothetical protein